MKGEEKEDRKDVNAAQRQSLLEMPVGTSAYGKNENMLVRIGLA